MTTEELLDMTILLEHLKGGGKKSCRDVNRVYGYLPKHPNGLLTKKQKIKMIEKYWNEIGDAVIAQYLINKQKPEENEK